MYALNWSDPQTYWLSVTNIVLGVVVVICFVAMLAGIAHELISRVHHRRRIEAESDRDMRSLEEGRAFQVPGLGITMAAGGVKLPPAPKRKQ